MEHIVGPLHQLPVFFRNGLYRLWRSGLSDAELQLAAKRCRQWIARARKNGYGTCECPCGTKLSVDTKNNQGISIWCLDHCEYTKTFRGILHESCNREVGSGDRQRKIGHSNYVLAHEARVQQDAPVITWQEEFPAPGVLD
ncbi:MAG TPA: hypothetical protein VGR55_00575 [Candidatus Acidoferrum sp.]|nr:hypothetical protein [Candidatus Acidoferrum sp.]